MDYSLLNLSDVFDSRQAELKSVCSLCWPLGDIILLPVILIGNVFTILAVQLSRRQRHVSSNQLILSLAISDLFVALAVLYHSFFYISESLAADKYACLLRFSLMFGACCASFFNVTAIALDRYIAIVHPLKHPKYMTGRTVKAVILVNWTSALFISSVPLFWNTYEAEHGCEIGTAVPTYYLAAVLLPTFLVAWLSIVIIYLRIWHEARVHAQRSQRKGPGNLDNAPCTRNRVITTILGCFSLCWLPYVAVAIAQVLGFPRRPGPLLYHAMYWLAMCNSAANPMIYTWKNRTFRRAFEQLLKFQLPRRTEYNSSFKRYLQRHAEFQRRERERIDNKDYRSDVIKTISAEVD